MVGSVAEDAPAAEAGDAGTAAGGAGAPAETPVDGGAKPNFTGSWKCVKNVNYQDFLAVQGARLLVRKAADAAATSQVIMHTGNTITINVTSVGVLNTSVTYTIDAEEATTSELLGRKFEDTLRWAGDRLQLTKINTADQYEIVAHRELRENGTKMVLELELRFTSMPPKKGSRAMQYFDRVPTP